MRNGMKFKNTSNTQLTWSGPLTLKGPEHLTPLPRLGITGLSSKCQLIHVAYMCTAADCQAWLDVIFVGWLVTYKLCAFVLEKTDMFSKWFVFIISSLLFSSCTQQHQWFQESTYTGPETVRSGTWSGVVILRPIMCSHHSKLTFQSAFNQLQ